MTRHRFEPARLVLGLLLLGAGLVCVLDVAGGWDVHTGLLLALVPAALVIGAVAGMTTYGVRRRLARRSAGREPDARGSAELGDMPATALREGYAHSRTPDGPDAGRAP